MKQRLLPCLRCICPVAIRIYSIHHALINSGKGGNGVEICRVLQEWYGRHCPMLALVVASIAGVQQLHAFWPSYVLHLFVFDTDFVCVCVCTSIHIIAFLLTTLGILCVSLLFIDPSHLLFTYL